MKQFLTGFALATVLMMTSGVNAAAVKLTFDGWEPSSGGTSKFKNGTKISDQYNTADYGNAEIWATSNLGAADPNTNYAGLYNTRKAGGKDSDLEPHNSSGKYIGFENTADSSDQFLNQRRDYFKVGKVLIIQEADQMAENRKGRYANPDDDRAGGIIDILFGTAVELIGFDYFDIDNGSAQREYLKVSYRDAVTDIWTSLLLDDFGGTGGDDTGRRYISPDNPLMTGLRFEFKSSGAIDNIKYALASQPVGGVAPVPIPGALPLFLTGLAGMALVSRRKKKQDSDLV